MTIEELRGLDDMVLLEELHKAAKNVSYFNAAEGDDWGKEQHGRDLANGHFRAVHVEAMKRGLSFQLGGYLL